MKRILRSLLPLLLLSALLAGCGRSGSAPAAESPVYSPAPQSEPAAVTPPSAQEPEVPPVTRAADPMPADEAEPEEPGFPLEEEPGFPLEEGYYPGGLDDDGRGEDEDNFSARVVSMTPEQQYEANVFLSNFAEQYFGNYSGNSDTWFSDAVSFAHSFLKINRRDAVEYRDAYEYIPYSTVAEVITRYFPVYLSEAMAEDYPADNYSFNEDGGFWFLAADGEAYNRFAVAEELTFLPDWTYSISFSVYELDLEEYFDNGLSSACYHLTPAEAASAPELTKVAEGEALALPYSYGDRATYQLLEYAVW